MKSMLYKVLFALAIFGSVGLAVAADRANMRGERYGEVLLGKGGLLMPREFDVYNTIGLNDCPQELWAKLDAKKIKADTGSKVVELNGPRYWTIDGIKGSTLVSQTQRNFGGIEMRQAGTLELTMKDKISFGAPYVVHKVARKTIWVYQAGKPIYQLISPDGTIYFMQSYSVQKEPQTESSLAALGSKLSLPKGWAFRTLNLKEDFFLKAENGMAYVTQDDLKNTYQRSTLKAGN